MSYWRTFLVVVLLALSLPIQSFAAVSMPCAGAAVPHEDNAPHTIPAAQDGHHDHGDRARHASSCAACVSCCIGMGMAGAPAAPVMASVRVTTVARPRSAGGVSFLTGGIDRPPRRIPV
ncbi:hypothetical protein K6W26_12260 [Burkholderia sp. AU42008]|uniref:hypothetical protein n=1 Tax=unclassified Burkholderia TaxID=2613784 RepID=UPI000B79D3BA|nr:MULTISPECIES: hypothetical protein [unclassified Burkholderia]MBR8235257.1 hypothetical protein [Burkholderia sp. AU32357]MBY4873843.1 hypothetical protein [Burkholderia sp. AU42008]OXI39914.1 hypothetical protein CFB49_17460 [Burkholderia sp. AU17457]